MQDFCRNRMGVADAHLAYMPWPEMLHRLVALQQSVRLSLRGEFTEHDIVMRIMRRDDYLIGAPLLCFFVCRPLMRCKVTRSTVTLLYA